MNLSGYRSTFVILTYKDESPETFYERKATLIFDNEAHKEACETDYYEDCRPKIQMWLNRHYPGEILNDDCDDEICIDHGPSDNDDVIDLRTN